MDQIEAANTAFIVESEGADTKENAVMANAANNIDIFVFMFLCMISSYIADKGL